MSAGAAPLGPLLEPAGPGSFIDEERRAVILLPPAPGAVEAQQRVLDLLAEHDSVV